MRSVRATLLALAVSSCGGSPPPTGPALSVDAALGGIPREGFARATEVRPFQFPRDHGPHPEFRNEWWYLTGNLLGPGQERFGFQVTFFRVALTPDPPDSPSRWAASQVWMAHAALTDVAAGTHESQERFARQALDLAGAYAAPLRVWLGDWQLSSGSEGSPWRLRVSSQPFDLDLELEPAKPVVPQGDNGLSRKSAEPGNASYYYSITRLRTEGEVRSGERRFRVQGSSWLDREWSTSALAPDQVGWDWLALQLADERELMFYRLRRADGSADPHSAGTLVDATGGSRRIGPGDVTLRPLRWWRSGERRYPIEWEIDVEPWDRRLRVEALLDDQLMDLSVRYWEGAVRVLDAEKGAPLGVGYLELAGY